MTHPLDRRRHLRHLREAAGAYEYQASISENGGSIANADKFKDRAYAIRWALRQLDPTEGQQEAPGLNINPLRAAE